jgi:hypothetical protein
MDNQVIKTPPLECKIWRNSAAQVQDKPHWTPYTVGVRWRDGMIREGSFSIDEEKIEEMADDPTSMNREQVLMYMIGQSLEQIFASREEAKAAEKASKLILPGRWK